LVDLSSSQVNSRLPTSTNLDNNKGLGKPKVQIKIFEGDDSKVINKACQAPLQIPVFEDNTVSLM
jgi:hypothetical protein